MLENGAGGGFGLGIERGGARRDRYGRCGGRRGPRDGSVSASTRRTCGVPATRSTPLGAWTTCSGGFDGVDRASTGCAWSISTTRDRSSDRASDRHEHVGRRTRSVGRGLGAHGHAPRPRARRLLPRDAGDGGRLRRGEHRPAAGPGRGPPAAGAAAGGVRDAQRQGPQRTRDDHAGGADAADRRSGDGRRRPAAPMGTPGRAIGERSAVRVASHCSRGAGDPARAPRPRRDHRACPASTQRGPLGRRPGPRHARAPAPWWHGARCPLLGPKTSIGDVPPRGRLLLPPGARGVPVRRRPGRRDDGDRAVGIAAVAATWWLARLVGGPSRPPWPGCWPRCPPPASTSRRSSGTRTWSRSFAALAFGGAIRARQTGRTRWWLVAGARRDGDDAAATSWGSSSLPPLVVALWCWTPRRAPAHGQAAAPALRAARRRWRSSRPGYLPLLGPRARTRLRRDARDPRLRDGRRPGGVGRPAHAPRAGRPAVDHLAVAGLITERPSPRCRRSPSSPDRASPCATSARGWRVAGGSPGASAAGRSRTSGRALARGDRSPWSVVALAVFAPSLATVTPGLPNDHYHAFLDPVVLALAGAGLAASVGLWPGSARRRAARIARARRRGRRAGRRSSSSP